jgi:transcriptional regulator with XRE-family HTH domain
MNISIHQYVIDQLQARKGEWPRVAEESGVSKRTIEKIARREVPNPGVQVVEQLARYFHQQEDRTAA